MVTSFLLSTADTLPLNITSGGSSLRYYFEKVAKHHGLEYAVTEYEKAEGKFTQYTSALLISNNTMSHTSVCSQILDLDPRIRYTSRIYANLFQDPLVASSVRSQK